MNKKNKQTNNVIKALPKLPTNFKSKINRKRNINENKFKSLSFLKENCIYITFSQCSIIELNLKFLEFFADKLHITL